LKTNTPNSSEQMYRLDCFFHSELGCLFFVNDVWPLEQALISDHSAYGNTLFPHRHPDATHDWHEENYFTKQGAPQSPELSCTRGGGDTNTTNERKMDVRRVEEGTDNGGEKRGATTLW